MYSRMVDVILVIGTSMHVLYLPPWCWWECKRWHSMRCFFHVNPVVTNARWFCVWSSLIEKNILCCIVLCCVVLCCIVLYCVVLYCVVLCCVVLCYIVFACQLLLLWFTLLFTSTVVAMVTNACRTNTPDVCVVTVWAFWSLAAGSSGQCERAGV